jgi:RND family efflux transporter MFP subunit
LADRTSQELQAPKLQAEQDTAESSSAVRSYLPRQEGPAKIAVQVVTPRRRNVTRTSRLPGTVAPWRQATLYAKVSGYLQWIGFDKGDRVKEGAVLAVIDAPEFQQQYAQAQSDYAIKQLTFERLTRVWQENHDVIAKQDVDVAEAAARGAQHLLEQRATMLAYTKVRAPFAGVITARFVDPGALIQVATTSETQASPLVTIMDTAKVRVYFNVPQEEASLARPGCPVKMSLSQQPGRIFTGALTRTTDVLDTSSRAMLAEADLSNSEGLLQPGSFAEVEIVLAQHPNAVLIPSTALVIEDANPAVFIVEEGHAKKVPIKSGLDDGVDVEVVDGLNGTEQVVVVGQSRLADGIQVEATAYHLPQGQMAQQKF